MSLQHSQQKTHGSHNMSTVQTCAMQILCECQVIPSTTILNAIANTLPANLRTTPSDKPWTFVTGQGCLLELLGYWQCPIAWSASCNLSYPSCWDIMGYYNQSSQTDSQTESLPRRYLSIATASGIFGFSRSHMCPVFINVGRFADTTGRCNGF